MTQDCCDLEKSPLSVESASLTNLKSQFAKAEFQDEKHMNLFTSNLPK